MEMWKDVINYYGKYIISSNGVIKSVARKNRLNDKIKKQRKDKDGYMIVNLHSDGKTKTLKVHRLLAEAFIYNPLNKPQVNHINGIKNDNRLQNIEWATQSENMQHSYDNGLTKASVGEKNGNSKLTTKDVEDMKKLRKFMTYQELANVFSVSICQAHRIINNKRWKHVKENI